MYLRNLYRWKEQLKKFFPVSCFSSYFTFLPLGDASVCSEKMAAPGENAFRAKYAKDPAYRQDHSCIV
jgi:hypothetical protein